MIVITDTAALTQFCESLEDANFITVDTEFMRERTFWSKLCLVQVGGPHEAAIIDPLADGIDLAPLLGLLNDCPVLKVFHAARQDIEIFLHMSGRVPTPVFDTQVAAMVCDLGDSVGYETLVSKLANARIDKTMRFTDWSRRPLSEKQLHYAISDVTHLRVAYEKLAARLAKNDRSHWLVEEMAILTTPATYQVVPREAWRRIKVRNAKPRFLAVLRELAAWREERAQETDVPRNRVMRDDMMLDIAAHAPTTTEELSRTRSVGRAGISGAMTETVLAAVRQGIEMPEDEWPLLNRPEPLPRGLGPLVDLLKVLLKMKCEDTGVAQRLVASSGDLDRIAADDDADVPALSGWRRELFGEDALRLKHGKLALKAEGKSLRLLDLSREGTADTVS